MKFWGGERVRFTKNVTNTMTTISNILASRYIESCKFFYTYTFLAYKVGNNRTKFSYSYVAHKRMYIEPYSSNSFIIK